MNRFRTHIRRILASGLIAATLCPGFSFAQTAAAPQESPDALWKTFEESWRAKAFDQSLASLQKLLALEKDALSYERRLKVRNNLGDCLVKLERYADARKAYESFIADEAFAAPRQDWWLAIARTYEKENNLPAAIDALEHVLTAQADKVETKDWFIALSLIADFKTRQGDMAAALEAARDCLAIADSKASCNSASSRIKQILQGMDKNPSRAKLFMDYQSFGTCGEDGVKGTADDLVNPLDAIPRAAQPPARLAAFAAAEKTLGCDTQALIQRGLMVALQGRNKEACAILMEACRRATGGDVATAYSTLLFVGVRGIHGHMAELKDYAVFLRLGPAGSAETGALSDPFASLGLPRWTAKPSAAEVEDMRYVVRRLEGIVIDVHWPDKSRREAASALLRVHSALGDWGDEGVQDWFAVRLTTEKDGGLFSALAHGFFAASRGGRVDWGETPQKLATVEQLPSMQKALTSPASNPLLVLQKLEASFP